MKQDQNAMKKKHSENKKEVLKIKKITIWIKNSMEGLEKKSWDFPESNTKKTS